MPQDRPTDPDAAGSVPVEPPAADPAELSSAEPDQATGADGSGAPKRGRPEGFEPL